MFGWLKRPAPFRVIEYCDKRVTVEEWINTEVGGFYSEVATCPTPAAAMEEIDRRKAARTPYRITEVE